MPCACCILLCYLHVSDFIYLCTFLHLLWANGTIKTLGIGIGNREVFLLFLPHRSLKYVWAAPVHEAPACAGSGEGSDHLGLLYAAFPCISARGCFQDLNPWPHGHKAAALPLRQGSPSTDGDQVEEKEQRLVLPFLSQFEERFDLCSYVRYAASVVQYRHRISVVASIEHLNDVPTYISFHH